MKNGFVKFRCDACILTADVEIPDDESASGARPPEGWVEITVLGIQLNQSVRRDALRFGGHACSIDCAKKTIIKSTDSIRQVTADDKPPVLY